MKNNAFTLIEILVVATIISLLVGTGAISYSQFIKQSRNARRKVDLEQIRAAIEQYRSDNGSYPVSISAGGNICEPSDCSDKIYMKNVPDDPLEGSNYYYSGSTDTYIVGSLLETQTASSCSGQSCGASTCNYCLDPYGEN